MGVRNARVSANPILSVKEIFTVGPLIKGFEVVHVAWGCWAVRKKKGNTED